MNDMTGSIGSSFQKMLIEGALKGFAHLHPQLAPLIQMLLDHESDLERLVPVLTAAAKEGPGAFAAAEKQAPELAAAIRNLVAAKSGEAASHQEAAVIVDHHAENFTRHLIGLHAMTPEEEKSWMDSYTPTGAGG